MTKLDVDAANFAIDVATSAVDVTRIDVDAQISTVDDVRFSAKKILACVDKLLGELSVTHARTNGVHSVFDKIHGAYGCGFFLRLHQSTAYCVL